MLLMQKNVSPNQQQRDLKNIHNGKEIKKLDGGNCRTANIAYAARYKLHGDIYTGNIGEKLRERYSNQRYNANLQHTYTNTSTNLTRIMKSYY